jgi:aspartate aminotransferase
MEEVKRKVPRSVRMDGSLSENIGGLTPSPTLAIAAKAKEMKNSGIDIVDLSAGQPDFPTPPFICEAAREAMEQGETRYTPASGIPQLREAIARKLDEDNALSYSPDQVVVTAGAKQAIFNAVFCLFGRGDEVLIPNPYWVSYPDIVSFAGADIKYVKTSRDNDFKMTLSDLEGAVSNRTKGLILNSPSNPTGSVHSGEELHDIWSFCRDRSIWIISDEIYEKIIFDDLPFTSIAGVSEDAPENVIVVNGFSKAYSMTGWRIGDAAGPLDAIKAMGSFQSHTTSNTCSISQWAALSALEQGEQSRAVHEDMLTKFSNRRRVILERAKELGLSYIHPQGAFYLFFETSGFYGCQVGDYQVKDSVSLCRYMLEVEKVALVPGIAFGRDDYTRLSYATSLEEIEKGIERLRHGFETLKDSSGHTR